MTQAPIHPDSIRITDTSTRDEIAEALSWTNQSAKRQQYVVEKFADDAPTAWTRMHRKINALLEDYENAPA